VSPPFAHPGLHNYPTNGARKFLHMTTQALTRRHIRRGPALPTDHPQTSTWQLVWLHDRACLVRTRRPPANFPCDNRLGIARNPGVITRIFTAVARRLRKTKTVPLNGSS